MKQGNAFLPIELPIHITSVVCKQVQVQGRIITTSINKMNFEGGHEFRNEMRVNITCES